MHTNHQLRESNRALAFTEFDAMDGQEIVYLTRRLNSSDTFSLVAPFIQADLTDDLYRYTIDLPSRNLPKALDVFRTLSLSELPGDRAHISLFMDNLTTVEESRTEGLAMWDALLRDSNQDVRSTAVMYLEGCLTSHAGGHEGLKAVNACNDEVFTQQTGLTKYQAEDLMLAYAYAENGQNLNFAGLGRTALAQKITETA